MVDLTAGLHLLGIEISSEVAQQEQVFLEEMLRWNKSINLTSIRSLDEALEKHLIDSLVLLPHLAVDGALLDLGSGGGLPGIPLQIARPGLRVTSVDSVGKKINFQKHIKRKLQLVNLTPIQVRIEDLGRQLPPNCRFDTVVARAFSSLKAICTLATPWLTESGQILVMKGPEGLAEYGNEELALAALGYSLAHCYNYQLPFSGAERQLLVIKKQFV